MIVTDIRQKLLIFMYEKGLNQKDTAKELGVSYRHFNSVMHGRYDVSTKMEIRIRDMFKRFGYKQALSEKGEL